MKSKEKYLLHDSGSETAPFSQFPSYITLFMRPGFTSQCPFAMVCLKIQGWAKKWSPGCEKFTGRSRQKWYAIAGATFTKPPATKCGVSLSILDKIHP